MGDVSLLEHAPARSGGVDSSEQAVYFSQLSKIALGNKRISFVGRSLATEITALAAAVRATTLVATVAVSGQSSESCKGEILSLQVKH